MLNLALGHETKNGGQRKEVLENHISVNAELSNLMYFIVSLKVGLGNESQVVLADTQYPFCVSDVMSKGGNVHLLPPLRCDIRWLIA